MVAGNLAGIPVVRQRQSHFESRGNFLRTRHGDKHRMEVGTVAMLGVTGPERVAPAPARSGLVITHGGEGVIVKVAAFFNLRNARFYLRSRQFSRIVCVSYRISGIMLL